jgi:glycosyltransferase involved in cell wall biosynthesis
MTGERSSEDRQTVLVARSRLLGYSETFIREQVRNLRTWRGVLVGEERVANGLDLDGLEVRWIGARGRISGALRAANRYLQRAPSSVVRALRKERPSLVHAHFGPDALKAWPAARTLGLPMLVTLHGYDVNVEPWWWRAGHAGRWLKRYPDLLKALAHEPAVHFLAVSSAIRQQAILRGIPQEKITVSHIGVDTKRFAPGPTPLSQRRDVLHVGRMVEKKGCRFLLEAFAAVQDEYPDSRLVLVGDGPLFDELARMARALRVRAVFLGALPAEQVADRIAQARIVCQPSITAGNGDAEGLPIVILEAQACGVPVITSARGGATDGIVPGKSGYSHAEKDVGAIARGLQSLLSDDDLAMAFGRAARGHIERHHALLRCTQALEEHYSQHAARAPR